MVEGIGMPGKDGTLHVIPSLIQEKLAAFEGLEPAFRESFIYIEQVHGQRRFPAVPLAAIVRYLHALWLCDRKDALLSVPLTLPRYDRRRALDLLLAWREGDSAAVVAFLEEKLDMLPFTELMGQIQDAAAAKNDAVVARLRHGRAILLNRGMNLHHALDTLFAPAPQALVVEVQRVCDEQGITAEEIRRQQALLDTPLYSYAPHAELARRNMVVMNSLGVRVTESPADRPGARTASVSPPEQPLPAYADAPIAHESEFTPPSFSTPAYFPTHTPPPVADEGPEEVVREAGDGSF
jgi:hypothetical protein